MTVQIVIIRLDIKKKVRAVYLGFYAELYCMKHAVDIVLFVDRK